MRLALSKDGRTKEHGIKEIQSMAVEGFAVTVLEVLPARYDIATESLAADYRVTLKVTR